MIEGSICRMDDKGVVTNLDGSDVTVTHLAAIWNKYAKESEAGVYIESSLDKKDEGTFNKAVAEVLGVDEPVTFNQLVPLCMIGNTVWLIADKSGKISIDLNAWLRCFPNAGGL